MEFPSDSAKPPSQILVHKIVNKLLDSLESKLVSLQISLETDLESVKTSGHSIAVESATAALLENAIQAMPDGGNLSVTLIDSPNQWELEVADNASRDFEEKIVSENNASLNKAVTVANQQGGEVQTWNCPLGGKAHVLVMPRSRPDSPQSNR
ncbi:MAG: hypothetical protein AAF939_00940 [Planctomycetota bacterium]